MPTKLFNNKINVSYLVCDDIKRPNTNSGLSWSTGFQMYKPFSLNNKQVIHQGPSVPLSNWFSDTVVGVAYLDKGILAFTNKEIVDNIVTNFSGQATASFSSGVSLKLGRRSS